MGTEAPTPLVIPVRCAPKKAPCPNCGNPGRRKRILTRTVRTVAYQAIALLQITYGEYAAACECSTTFRNSPEGIPAKAKYDNKVRDLVLDRLLKDGMSVERALASIRREFLLDLSTGFVYDVIRDRVAELDLAAHRQEVLRRFSGTLCVDELHLGRSTLLLATDPLADLPVAFALVSRDDAGHMHRFLGNLKAHGFLPQVVVTDGSPLYPGVLAELWPHAEHQLCVFHAIKEINGLILDAVRRIKAAMARRGQAGRKKKRGRKTARARAAAARRGLTLKEKAHFIFRHRYLVVRRHGGLSQAERGVLRQLCEYSPELAVLRRFADRVYRLFDTPKDLTQAQRRRSGILRDARFGAVPELVAAMKHLEEAKFAKLMASLKSPVGRRVRTNNHVERTNRLLRFFEKVRYKWRRRRSVVRFLVLKLDEVWTGWVPPQIKQSDLDNSDKKSQAPPKTEQRIDRAA